MVIRASAVDSAVTEPSVSVITPSATSCRSAAVSARRSAGSSITWISASTAAARISLTSRESSTWRPMPVSAASVSAR